MTHLWTTLRKQIKTLPTEGRVILALTVAMLATEAAFRMGDRLLSKDVAHLRSLNQTAAKIESANTSPRIVIGNSLARCGIDPTLLNNPSAVFMTPDGTGVAEWAYAFRRYVMHRQQHPREVWIITGPAHLIDGPIATPERFGQFFVGSQDRSSFIAHELNEIEGRSQFLLGAASVAYADRNRLQPLLFYNFVPGYEETARQIDQTLTLPTPTKPSSQTVPTCHHLTLLLDSIQECGSRAVIISVPLPKPYSLAAPVIAAAEAHECRVVELGKLPSPSADAFSDGYHLTPAAAKIVTQQILAALASSGPR